VVRKVVRKMVIKVVIKVVTLGDHLQPPNPPPALVIRSVPESDYPPRCYVRGSLTRGSDPVRGRGGPGRYRGDTEDVGRGLLSPRGSSRTADLMVLHRNFSKERDLEGSLSIAGESQERS
jgi:hypothetical protein